MPSSSAGSSASIRCSITGITTIDWQRSSCAVRSAVAGSKERRSTTVEPSSIASARCAKPQVWKSGAAMCVRHPARSGIRESSETAASMPASLRGAPLGVPVVPEVRITMRAWRSGGCRSPSSYADTSCSSVSGPSGPPSPSVQASTRRSTWASGEQAGELLVVHDQAGRLALEHVDQLRARRRRC